jgi:hypothetical protein
MDLAHLDTAIQKVEFKLTVLAADEPKVQALLERGNARPQRRKVYFYDTKALALFGGDLVLRARVTDGDDDDSTVKLRPVDLSARGAAWRAIDGVRVELDVVGDRHVTSAKLDGTPDRGEIEQVEEGQRPLASLFGGRQEQLIGDYAPDGIGLGELAVLGPVDARKWDLERPEGFAYDLGIEEWSLPNATHFTELSFKVDAGEAAAAQPAFRRWLAEQRIDATGDQEAKTPRVLKFFAERL